MSAFEQLGKSASMIQTLSMAPKAMTKLEHVLAGLRKPGLRQVQFRGTRKPQSAFADAFDALRKEDLDVFPPPDADWLAETRRRQIAKIMDMVKESSHRQLEKRAIVEKVDGKWVLWTKDKSRRLGTHDTAQEAYAQEYAIEKSQEREAEKAASIREWLSGLLNRPHGYTESGRATEMQHVDAKDIEGYDVGRMHPGMFLYRKPGTDRVYFLMQGDKDGNPPPFDEKHLRSSLSITDDTGQPDLSEITSLSTAPEHRRKGYARAILRAIEPFESDKFLLVKPDPIGDKSVAASDIGKLYESEGFLPDKNLEDGYTYRAPLSVRIAEGNAPAWAMQHIAQQHMAKSAANDPIARLVDREGGHKKITKDSGGVTKGGIAESGGVFTKAQIRKLTPQQIDNFWRSKREQTKSIQQPGVREIIFDMEANMGPRAWMKAREQANAMLPADQRLRVIPSPFDATAASRVNGLMQDEYAAKLMGAYKTHHEALAKSDPVRYPSKVGWENRRNKLWNSPEVTPLHRVYGAPNSPRPAPAPVKVGLPAQPPAGYSVVKSGAVASGLRAAINATHTHPTPAQAHAGNYRKGEFDFRPGLTIKIENPDGSTRRGYGKDGKEIWSRVMRGSYGYFKGTKAIDGDAVDVFVGPDLDSETVVAIDQYKGDTFDETKFVVGVKTQKQGEQLYLSNYPKGWKLGPVSTLTVSELQDWLKTGRTKKPFKGQMVKSAAKWDKLWSKGALSVVS